MGHKVNPKSFRLGTSADWNVRWFGRSDYAKLLKEDVQIRDYLAEKLARAGLDSVHLERSKNQITLTLNAARPGVIIGRGGAGIEAIRKDLDKITAHGTKLQVNIEEVHQPDLAARVVAETIATQLEKRIAFRRAMRQGIDRVMKAGAEGVKMSVSGRLGGADMARTQLQHDGKVPLHTIRANIDYGYVLAKTTYGTIGVKVWIYKGEVGAYAERKDDQKDYGFAPPPLQPKGQANRGGTSAPAAKS
ncbi:30S ribosomal protein S3 [Patescibacteria group bacterium]|nr:30S ribosomal protein S3 [Patescibacteria group bacterium]